MPCGREGVWCRQDPNPTGAVVGGGKATSGAGQGCRGEVWRRAAAGSESILVYMRWRKAEEVVADVVQRVQQGARRCVAVARGLLDVTYVTYIIYYL